ncbi:unnamed protein product [Menidia menidia]|uniref:(Atlantic silverside) hypothetical protein n=1 Tax=Menidia menidia TaxID=238744 RepID=A0A8S4AAA1_9TELE|nr:unnamed protein product [Menidia menidia]
MVIRQFGYHTTTEFEKGTQKKVARDDNGVAQQSLGSNRKAEIMGLGERVNGLAQLKTRRPPIPTLFLANVHLLYNKVYMLRKSWLNNNMTDSAFQIDGLLLFKTDRNQRPWKIQGGGFC